MEEEKIYNPIEYKVNLDRWRHNLYKHIYKMNYQEKLERKKEMPLLPANYYFLYYKKWCNNELDNEIKLPPEIKKKKIIKKK